MALNMNNKKLLTSQILPEVEININPNGITISSARLLPPRFIPYDQGGKCRECKSTEVELDFVVTKEGITIYCTRISGTRFVPFDIVYDLPGICFFKVTFNKLIKPSFILRSKTKAAYSISHIIQCHLHNLNHNNPAKIKLNLKHKKTSLKILLHNENVQKLQMKMSNKKRKIY